MKAQAEQGMLFADYYAEPSCAAGRSAFPTGQFPVRTGLHSVGLPGDPIGLSSATPTRPELPKTLGYTTGQFGKNHLGEVLAKLEELGVADNTACAARPTTPGV